MIPFPSHIHHRSHADLVLPRFSHSMVAFGGGAGRDLHEIMEDEEALFGGKGPEDYFSPLINVCPQQVRCLPALTHRLNNSSCRLRSSALQGSS